ncbi:uncharacterized protein LOC134830587 [Culicoides brevitarsis]|uniref:uncharacterized protein LOC134830587 n=1 Tax=Culicoides brevitarsis TaxID=469753 RepID=UPI00307C4EF1
MSPRRKRTRSDGDQQVKTDETNNDNISKNSSKSNKKSKFSECVEQKLLKESMNEWFRQERLTRRVEFPEIYSKTNEQHEKICNHKECDFKANNNWVRDFLKNCSVSVKTVGNTSQTNARDRHHGLFIENLFEWHRKTERSERRSIFYDELLNKAIEYHTEYCKLLGCFFKPDKLFIIQFKRKFNLFPDKENVKVKKELEKVQSPLNDEKTEIKEENGIDKEEKHKIIKKKLLGWINEQKELNQDFTFSKAQITRTAKDFHKTCCGERCWKKIKKFFKFLREFFEEYNVSYSFDLSEEKNSSTMQEENFVEPSEDQTTENIEKTEAKVQENEEKDEKDHIIIEIELLKWYNEQENTPISKSQIRKSAKELHKMHCKGHCWKKIKTNENFQRFFENFIAKYNLSYSDEKKETAETTEETSKNDENQEITTSVQQSEDQETKIIEKSQNEEQNIHKVFEEKLLEWYKEQKEAFLVRITKNQFVTTTEEFHRKYCLSKNCVSKYKLRMKNFVLATEFMKKHNIDLKVKKIKLNSIVLSYYEQDEIMDCLDSIALNTSANSAKIIKNEEIEPNQNISMEETEATVEKMKISNENLPLSKNANSTLISNDVDMTKEIRTEEPKIEIAPKIDEKSSIPSDSVEKTDQKSSFLLSFIDHPEVASSLYEWYKKSNFTYRLPFNQLQDIINTFHSKSCQIPECDFLKFENCSRWLYRSFYPTYNIDPLPRQTLPTEKEILDAFDLLIKYFTEEKVTEMEWSLKAEKEIFVKKLQSETKNVE